MLINFDELEEQHVQRINNGTGTLSAKMYVGENGKIIPCRIHVGGSIGLHRHDASDDINYILSGNGTAICDNVEETLTAGVCHVCKKGSVHSIINTGAEDLVMLTIVVERAKTSKFSLFAFYVTIAYCFMCFLSAGSIVFGAYYDNYTLFKFGKAVIYLWFINPMGFVVSMIGLINDKPKRFFLLCMIAAAVSWIIAGLMIASVF